LTGEPRLLVERQEVAVSRGLTAFRRALAGILAAAVVIACPARGAHGADDADGWTTGHPQAQIVNPDEIPFPDAKPRAHDEIPYPDAQPRAHDEIDYPDARPHNPDEIPYPDAQPRSHDEIPFPDAKPRNPDEIPYPQ
jgi:hypothetical protein